MPNGKKTGIHEKHYNQIREVGMRDRLMGIRHATMVCLFLMHISRDIFCFRLCAGRDDFAGNGNRIKEREECL